MLNFFPLFENILLILDAPDEIENACRKQRGNKKTVFKLRPVEMQTTVSLTIDVFAVRCKVFLSAPKIDLHPSDKSLCYIFYVIFYELF